MPGAHVKTEKPKTEKPRRANPWARPPIWNGSGKPADCSPWSCSLWPAVFFEGLLSTQLGFVLHVPRDVELVPLKPFSLFQGLC